VNLKESSETPADTLTSLIGNLSFDLFWDEKGLCNDTNLIPVSFGREGVSKVSNCLGCEVLDRIASQLNEKFPVVSL